MNTKNLIKVIKSVVKTNSILPILENVNLDQDTLTVTDLETTVIVPYKSGITDSIGANHFITAVEMMKEPVFSNEVKKGIDEKGNTTWDSKVEVSQGKQKIKLTGEDPDNFPLVFTTDQEDMNLIGSITETELGYMETALKFTSKDDLRPAMTGIFMDGEICATDAHRLYHKPISSPLLESFIVPGKTARILLTIGGSWDIYFSPYKAAFINSDGIIVAFRPIDARFPDYKVVLPEGSGNAMLIWHSELMRKEIKNALKFSNRSTSMVVLHMNGKVTISSQDVDFGYEYNNELEGVENIKKIDEIRIGFNGKFLDEIIAQLPSDEPLKIKLWASNRAAIINNDFLIMPLMLAGE